MANNEVRMEPILVPDCPDQLAQPPRGTLRSIIKLGGTTRKPCDHGTTVCADCIESWSWDYWIDITPGIIDTFEMRYRKFPYKIITDPECHVRISQHLYDNLKAKGLI